MLLDACLSASFESYVEKILDAYSACGIAVAIIDQNGPAAESFFGFRDRERRLPIDRDTIFGLASVTKSFTCLAILQLAEQGKVDLDAPVCRYIPAFQNTHRAKPVLVRHLMSHTGSFWPVKRKTVEPLARRMGIWGKGVDLAYSVPFSEEAVREVSAGLDAQEIPLGNPGEYFSYSNDSFGLLSDIIRTQGGEDTYADYLNKEILLPLNMTRSGCGFLPPAADPNGAILYEERDGRQLVTRDYHDDAFVMMGGGAVKSTLRDMQQYLSLFLQEGAPLIRPDSFRRMTRSCASYRPAVGYGFGLATGRLAGHTVFGHGGSLTGVSSAIGLCPDAGAGVCVLSNTTGVPASSIAEAALRLCLGEEPHPWEPPCLEPWPADLQQKAVGRYVSLEGSDIEIQTGETGMRVLSSGQEKAYRFGAPGILYLKSKMTWSDLTLFPDGKGDIFALRYGGRMLARQK
ncbi:MAG: beta-lactamase family protein [Oscillospiraceae bacterium]|nr:beta-lactamase family protein [Oscillospiraceae bacterium]